MKSWHVGLTVENLDEAVNFFTQGLKFEVAVRRHIKGEYLGHMLAESLIISADIAMIKVSEGMLLELVEYNFKPEHNKEDDIRHFHITSLGQTHFAYFVENLAEAEQLVAQNFLSPIAKTYDTVPAGPFMGSKIRFYRTNFGCIIEVIERPEEFVS